MPLTRKSTRSKTRKQSNRGRFIGPRGSSKPKLARFAPSVSRYSRNRVLSASVKTFAETKLLACNRLNNQTATPIHSGSSCFYKAFVIGTMPTTWTGTFTNLGGVAIQQGSTSDRRDGNYVYMKKTHLSVNVDMVNQATGARPPVQFRVIVGKSKRANTPAGYSIDPSTSLFINEGGTHFGHSSTAADGSDIMLQPLNKRDFYFKFDRKMILSVPFNDNLTGYSGKYPVTKDLFFNLGYWKKTRYEDSGSFANLPSDLDTAYFVIIYARSVEKATNANDWEVNVRGTTSFSDI